MFVILYPCFCFKPVKQIQCSYPLSLLLKAVEQEFKRKIKIESKLIKNVQLKQSFQVHGEKSIIIEK